ncbi:MAG: VCBS repeat-containing protein [Planctomycetota bacterium]
MRRLSRFVLCAVLAAPGLSQDAPGPPSTDRTEALSSAFGAALKDVAAAELTGGAAWERVESLFGPASRGVVREDAIEWRTVAFTDGLSGVEAAVRSTPVLEAGPRIDLGTGPEDAVDDVAAAFEALGLALEGPPTESLQMSVKRVAPVGAGDAGLFDSRVRVRAIRSDAAGRSTARAIWLVRWRVDDEDALELVAFEQHLVERASIASEGSGEWFPDVAPALLGHAAGRAAFRRARASIHDLRDALDVDMGVGILGHHGVAVADVTGDGIDDVFLPQPGGVPNQLWVRTPDGRAVDAAQSAGLDHLDATTSALFLDLDGDGDRDAVLALGGGIQFLVQTRDGFRPGPFVERGSMTGLAAADVDADGRIDIYGCAYADPYRGLAFPVPYHDAENGQANVLLVNRTDEPDRLLFADETDARGLGVGATRFSFAATFDDIDDDGDADLYVANDFGRNALYVNQGNGTFTEEADARGCVDIGAGMAAAFDDIDGDGRVDLYVCNMESSAGRRVTGRDVFRTDLAEDTRDVLRRHAKGNTLLLGAEGGRFVEAPGVAAAGRWAWGGLPVDLDGDGLLDLHVPNGFVSARRGAGPDL